MWGKGSCGCSGPYHDCIVTGTAYRCKHVLQPRISPPRVEAPFEDSELVAACEGEGTRRAARAKGITKGIHGWERSGGDKIKE